MNLMGTDPKSLTPLDFLSGLMQVSPPAVKLQ